MYMHINMFCRRAAPRQNAAPLGGSAVREAISVGALCVS